MISNILHRQIVVACSFVLAFASNAYVQTNRHLHTANPPRTPSSTHSTGIESVVRPFYEAQIKRDWAAISSYMYPSSETQPQRYYFDPWVLTLNPSSVWALHNAYPVSLADGLVAERVVDAVLVTGIFRVTLENRGTQKSDVARAEISSGLFQPRIRTDLWIKKGGKWMVVPEGFFSESLTMTSLPENRARSFMFDKIEDLKELSAELDLLEQDGNAAFGTYLKGLADIKNRTNNEDAALALQKELAEQLSKTMASISERRTKLEQRMNNKLPPK